jgi:hypothetical protein
VLDGRRVLSLADHEWEWAWAVAAAGHTEVAIEAWRAWKEKSWIET